MIEIHKSIIGPLRKKDELLDKKLKIRSSKIGGINNLFRELYGSKEFCRVLRESKLDVPINKKYALSFDFLRVRLKTRGFFSAIKRMFSDDLTGMGLIFVLIILLGGGTVLNTILFSGVSTSLSSEFVVWYDIFFFILITIMLKVLFSEDEYKSRRRWNWNTGKYEDINYDGVSSKLVDSGIDKNILENRIQRSLCKKYNVSIAVKREGDHQLAKTGTIGLLGYIFGKEMNEIRKEYSKLKSEVKI